MTTRLLTEDERDLMSHIMMWGSDGYPVHLGKRCRNWTWGPWRSVKRPPTVFRTKREAVASFEAFMDVLREAFAEESKARALCERQWLHAQVSCEHEGRTLLGDVRDVSINRRTGRPVLFVRHFDGSAWPFEPEPHAVTNLRAEGGS